MSSRSSFEELATLFEGSGTCISQGAGQTHHYFGRRGYSARCASKMQKHYQKEKEIATAIYLYRVDCDGEWGEIYFDFVNRTTEIQKLAEWDRMISQVFAKKAIIYLTRHVDPMNVKQAYIVF